MASKRKKLSLIQIARAVAIMFVLLGHLNILFNKEFGYDWFDMGEWERTGGVDFFYIVTGFMIYYIYHNVAGVPGKARHFLLKRAIRVYPLYWIFTFAAIVVSLFIPSLDGGYTLEVIVESVLIFPTEPILASTWSLSHVILFYIIFSAYLYRPAILKPFITLWFLLNVLIVTNLIPIPQTFFFSFSNLEIMVGCLVAYCTLNYSVYIYGPFIWFIMGVVGYIFVWMNNIFNVININGPIFYCLFSMLIMLGLSEMDKVDRKLPKLLSYLGDASYSIYIAHGPFLQFYILILKKLNLISILGYFSSMLLLIFLSTLSSCLVYSLLEKPLYKYLRKLVETNKKDAFTLAAAITE
jgi:exopolysaccharide production protein ExoZ